MNTFQIYWNPTTNYWKNILDNKFEFLKKHSALITTLLVFIVYLFTLAPSVIQIDSGELAAVQKTLGIAHPTGYPLFTIIGYIFLKIPLPFTDIYKANLLAALWCSIGIYFFINSAQLILRNAKLVVRDKKTKAKRIQTSEPDENEFIKLILPSVAGGLLLAFSKTFWMQSTSVEVYSFQIFLFNLIAFVALSAFFNERDKIKHWIFVAIALALGFANHMTTLLILPLIAVLFFGKEKFNASAIKKIGVMLAVFFPLLALFYLYIPLRASSNPAINWGNVISGENFWRHFTGRQYQVWLFSSFDSAKKQLSYFLENLPAEFVYIGLIIAVVGIFSSFKYSKKIFLAIFLTFIFSVFYSINYDIVDIDSYFLLSYIMFCFFGVFGFGKIISMIKSKVGIAVTVCVLPILFESTFTFSKVDQSGNKTFEDYTLAILNNADPNSVIFSYQWDYFISPSYYFQHAEGIRNDVAIVDKELLRRSWYYNQMNHNYAGVIKSIKPEINDFLKALKPFERDEQFDSALLEKYYRAIMTKLILENAGSRSFYIGLELFQGEMQRGEFSLPAGYQLVPDLFMLKIIKGNYYVPAKDPDFIIRPPKNGNKYTDNILNFVCSSLVYRAQYELIYNKKDRARLYINKIKKDYPSFRIPSDVLQKVE
jgi:hypothetical protein